jgi:hypothetical protein
MRFIPERRSGVTQTRNVMRTGQGRMILRDGAEVPLTYCLAILKDRSRCHGTLFGDLSQIDAQEFTSTIRYVLADGEQFMLRVTTSSDVDLTFVGDLDQLAHQNDSEVIA